MCVVGKISVKVLSCHSYLVWLLFCDFILTCSFVLMHLERVITCRVGTRLGVDIEHPCPQALLWMFNESRSFYFCPEGDLTQCLQRQPTDHETEVPHWQMVRYM